MSMCEGLRRNAPPLKPVPPKPVRASISVATRATPAPPTTPLGVAQQTHQYVCKLLIMNFRTKMVEYGNVSGIMNQSPPPSPLPLSTHTSHTPACQLPVPTRSYPSAGSSSLGQGSCQSGR